MPTTNRPSQKDSEGASARRRTLSLRLARYAPSCVVLAGAVVAVVLAVAGASGGKVSETLLTVYLSWALALVALAVTLILADKPLRNAFVLFALTSASSVVALLIMAGAITTACSGGGPCPFS